MSQPRNEMGHTVTIAPAAQPLTASLSISPPTHPSTSPPTSSTPTSATSRTAKSGNGSGNNTTGILKTGTAAHQHHHNSHRATKRAGSTASSHSHHSTHSAHSHSTHSTYTTQAHTHNTAHSPGHSHDNDGRPKRVWKACERCRMKKTKCDGEFPCKRCKDDGLVCTAGTRKKTEYKQIPKGYAEVLENTQVALVATIHKLYAMVQSGQPWTLGEPELNERGQPVIHSIASKLGCIRPNNDPDLPFGSSIFPECDKDLTDLQSQLHDYHKQREAELPAALPADILVKTEDAATANQLPTVAPAAARKRLPTKAPLLMSASAPTANTHHQLAFDAASASSPEDLGNLSDMDDYRKNVFGRSNRAGSSGQSASTMSPQSLTFTDFDSAVATTTTGTSQSSSDGLPTTTPFTNWAAPPGISISDMQAMNLASTLQQQQNAALELQMRQQMHGSKAAALQYLGQQQPSQQAQQQQQAQQTTQAQQQQQQTFAQDTPMISASGVGSNMSLLGTNPNFFTADMLQQSMYESNFGALKMNTDAMLGGVDPMIFDGGYDEPLM